MEPVADDRATVHVVCGDNWPQHRVYLSPKGQLCLLDHSPADIRAELAAFGLGGRMSPCVDILHRWRVGQQKDQDQFSFHTNAPVTSGHMYKAWVERVRRRNDRQAYKSAPFDVFVAAQRVREEKLDAVRQDRWRQFGHVANRSVAARTVAAAFDANENLITIAGSYSKGPKVVQKTKRSRLSVRLNHDWWRKVWLRKLTVIDRHLILDADTMVSGVVRLVGVTQDAPRDADGVLENKPGEIRGDKVVWLVQQQLKLAVPEPTRIRKPTRT